MNETELERWIAEEKRKIAERRNRELRARLEARKNGSFVRAERGLNVAEREEAVKKFTRTYA